MCVSVCVSGQTQRGRFWLVRGGQLPEKDGSEWGKLLINAGVCVCACVRVCVCVFVIKQEISFFLAVVDVHFTKVKINQGCHELFDLFRRLKNQAPCT
jgi:hypothetical protein